MLPRRPGISQSPHSSRVSCVMEMRLVAKRGSPNTSGDAMKRFQQVCLVPAGQIRCLRRQRPRLVYPATDALIARSATAASRLSSIAPDVRRAIGGSLLIRLRGAIRTPRLSSSAFRKGQPRGFGSALSFQLLEKHPRPSHVTLRGIDLDLHVIAAVKVVLFNAR